MLKLKAILRKAVVLRSSRLLCPRFKLAELWLQREAELQQLSQQHDAELKELRQQYESHLASLVAQRVEERTVEIRSKVEQEVVDSLQLSEEQLRTLESKRAASYSSVNNGSASASSRRQQQPQQQQPQQKAQSDLAAARSRAERAEAELARVQSQQSHALLELDRWRQRADEAQHESDALRAEVDQLRSALAARSDPQQQQQQQPQQPREDEEHVQDRELPADLLQTPGKPLPPSAAALAATPVPGERKRELDTQEQSAQTEPWLAAKVRCCRLLANHLSEFHRTLPMKRRKPSYKRCLKRHSKRLNN